MKCVAIGAGSSVLDVEGRFVLWNVCKSIRKTALPGTGRNVYCVVIFVVIFGGR